MCGAIVAPPRNRTLGDELDWLDLQVQGNRLLRDLAGAHFTDELDRLHKRLVQQTERNPDGALFALFHLAASEIQLYSATHSMLVSVALAILPSGRSLRTSSCSLPTKAF